MTARGDAIALRAEIERIVRQVVFNETSRTQRRVVVAVHEPKVKGRGGTCDVQDSLGNVSYGVRWFETRPLAGDVVLVDVPPPGGTRRVLAIDREMQATSAASIASYVPAAVYSDPDANQIAQLPDLPHAGYPEGTTILLTSNNAMYQVIGSQWVQQVEGPTGGGIAGQWKRAIYNGDFHLPPPDPTQPLNNDTNKLPGWSVQAGDNPIYWVADTTVGSGGKLTSTFAGAAAARVIADVDARSSASRNNAAGILISGMAGHHATMDVFPTLTAYDSAGTSLGAILTGGHYNWAADSTVGDVISVANASSPAATNKLRITLVLTSSVADVATLTEVVLLEGNPPVTLWPDLSTPGNQAAFAQNDAGILAFATTYGVSFNRQFILAGARVFDLSGNTDDWNDGQLPFNSLLAIRPSAGGFYLGGMTGGAKGRVLVISNYPQFGNFTFRFAHEAATSTAANRFACANNADEYLPPGGTVVVWYDSNVSRWRVGSVDYGTPTTIAVADAATAGTTESHRHGFPSAASLKGTLGYYTSGDSPTFATITTTGSIELGNASDTTIARSGAGAITVEGVGVALYTTGTWTPSLQFATVGTSSWASTTATGFYTKWGDRVAINWSITSTPTNGTASGALQLAGLPFTSQNTSGSSSRFAVSVQGYTKANFTWVIGNLGANLSAMNFPASGSGQSITNLAVGDIPSLGVVQVNGSGVYMV